ncbi:MAG: signal peptidase II [Bryobacteraceae bacterium]|jgi:signal peptidase II
MADARTKAYVAAGAIFVLDRTSKWIVERYVTFSDDYRVIPGLFDIVRSQNRGVAFGIGNDSAGTWLTLLLAAVSLAAVVLIAGILWKGQRVEKLTLWGLACILGGAAGNVFDRLASGQVTDFLELYIGQYHWPTFNVADSAIVIGSGLFLIDAFRSKRQIANVP